MRMPMRHVVSFCQPRMFLPSVQATGRARARLLGAQAQRLRRVHGPGQAAKPLAEQRLQLPGVVRREGQQRRARAQAGQRRQRALGQVQRVGHARQHEPRARQLPHGARACSGLGSEALP
jgi:hypothetical protein